MIFITSCQKNLSVTEETLDNGANQEMVNSFISANPGQTKISVDQSAQIRRVDDKDNTITTQSIKNQQTLLGSGAGCYDIDNDVPVTAVLENYAVTASCSGNYTSVFVNYKISSKNAVVAANPNNAAQKTRGRIRIFTTSTGTTIYNNTTIPIISISDLGVDPSEPTHRLYRINYSFDNLLTTDFNNFLNTKQFGLYFYTECPEESIYPYLLTTAVALPTACQVAHPVYVNPGVGFRFIAGVNACTNCCAHPSTLPTSQQVQFSTNANFTGSPLTYNITIVQTLSNPSGLVGGTNYYVRWRNIATGCTTTITNPPSSPWSAVSQVVW